MYFVGFQSSVNGYNKSLTEDSDAGSIDKDTTIPDVLRELSNHNERSDLALIFLSNISG